MTNTSTIPTSVLPPAEFRGGPKLVQFIAYIVARFKLITPDITEDFLETLCPILQMLVPLDDITGIALSEDERNLELNSKKVPLLCKLAGHFTDPEEKAISKGIQDLGLILRAEETLLHFPIVGEKPRPGKNPLWCIHAELCQFPAYSLFACNLQVGLVTAWKAYGWRTEKIKTLASLVTAVRRILPLLPVDELKVCLHLSDEQSAADIIRLTADNLTYLGRQEWLPLDTREQYFRDFCTALDKESWLEFPRRERGGGRSGQHHRATFYDLEDDLQEGGDAPDGYLTSTYEGYAMSLAQELDDDEDRLDGEEDIAEDLPKGQYIYFEERAVMQEYLTPLAWNCCHPQELAWLVAQVITPLKNKALGILILSIIFLGRSSQWLLSIIIGQDPERLELLETPVYYPDLNLILYPPELVKSYPTHPLKTEDLFIPVSRNWRIPLPDVLVPLWRNQARDKRPGDSLFPEVMMETIKGQLKSLTEQHQTRYPHAPKFTEGRLRRAFTVLTTQAGLNEVYGAMISGQWRLPLRVPLHYTTVSVEQLAVRFLPASQRMLEQLRKLNSSIPDGEVVRNMPEPEIYQGSPYHPRKEVLVETIEKLILYLLGASSPHKHHNTLTLTAFIGMDLFCGLRFGELCQARRPQFDLDAVWQGQPRPWLQLPDAKGNRFTTASRLVPIPEFLLTILKKVLRPATDPNVSAFWCWEENLKKDINRAILDTWREEAGIPLLRWHSCRQELNSGLFLQTPDMFTANLILGHQSSGREMFNPYLANTPGDHWLTYLAYCEKFATEIGWERVLHAIQENLAGIN